APSGPVANRSHLREETHAKPTESCNQMGTRSTDSTCAGIVVALVPSASCCMVPTASADFLPAGVRSSMQTVDNLREEGRAGQPTMTERCPPSTAVIVSQARAQRHCSTAAAYAYSASALPPPSPSRSSMRLFTATLATETNTFSPLPTSLENYRESVFFRPGEHPADAPRMCTAPLFVGRARAAKEGFELIEGSCFAASPAGTTNRTDYETMRDEILGQLKAALPVDGLLLGLHGAMVAHGYDDVEGDIIEKARAIVGPKC